MATAVNWWFGDIFISFFANETYGLKIVVIAVGITRAVVCIYYVGVCARVEVDVGKNPHKNRPITS